MSSFTKFFMVATATLMSTAQANACWFGNCFSAAPRTTFYAPIAPAPCAAPVASCNPCSTCNTCAAPTTVGYAPYSAGYTPYSVGYAPYTAYRPTLFGGYRPYTAGYAPYSVGYAPAAYTSYSAGYAPYSVGYTPYTSYYAPTTVLSPSCGCNSCASPCSSCSTGTCNSCNTSVPSTTTFAPSSVTPTTYIQSTTPSSGCSTCGVNSVTSTTPSSDNRYFTSGTTSTVSANTTFSNTNAGTQFVTGSSEMRAVKSTNAQTPIAEETNRTEAPKSNVGGPIAPGRQYDPENKTTLRPITAQHERLVEVPRILPISQTTAKPLAGEDWGR